MGKKVIRSKIIGICRRCGFRFDLDETCIRQMEVDTGTEPFSARSSSGRIHCPDCGHLGVDPHYEYAQKYRVRCQTCKKMFDADFSNASRCPKCDHDHLIAMSKLGAN